MATQKKSTKSAKLAEKIAAMQRELEETQRAESEAADRELIRLAHRAGIRDELMDDCRRRIARTKQQRDVDATTGTGETR